MSTTPNKEDLPRIADALKTELVGEKKLKHIETEEKIVLPSKSGMFFDVVIVHNSFHF